MTVGWDDIGEDLEATAKASKRLARFDQLEADSDAAAAADRRLTRGRRGMLPGGPPGRALVERCGRDTQIRYRTLLCAEPTFAAENDHGFLIVPACQILEVELGRVLVEPARTVARDLVAALRGHRSDASAAEIVAKWAEQKVPPTLGVMAVVLLAIRRALEDEIGAVAVFVESAVEVTLLTALRERELGRRLDEVRRGFRNPACHGSAVFGPNDYSEFVSLLVTRGRFAEWDCQGGSANGVLHATLAGRRPLK